MSSKYHQRPCECSADHRALIMDRIDLKPDGCWLWKRAQNGYGYGQLRHNKLYAAAHRFAYFTFIGQIPDGMQLDHLCRNRACVNPEHLEPVTALENCRRGDGSSDQRRRLPLIAGLRLELAPGDPQHGTVGAYTSYKCRCESCTAAANEYDRARWLRRKEVRNERRREAYASRKRNNEEL